MGFGGSTEAAAVTSILLVVGGVAIHAIELLYEVIPATAVGSDAFLPGTTCNDSRVIRRFQTAA